MKSKGSLPIIFLHFSTKYLITQVSRDYVFLYFHFLDQKTPSSTSSGIVMGPFLLKQIMVNTLEQKSQGTFMPIAMISVKTAASIIFILSIVLSWC